MTPAENAPANPPVNPVVEAMAAADAAYDAGSFDEAARRYARVLAFAPAHPLLLYNVAAARRDAGAPRESAPWFLRVTFVDPNLVQARAATGEVMLALGRMAEAVTHLTGAAALAPTDGEARRRMGDAVKSAGDFAGAVAIYRRSAALAPDRAPTWFNLGVTEADRFHHDDAIIAHRRAAAAAPDDVAARFNLAHELLLRGRLAEGFAAYECRFDGVVPRPAHPLPWWRGESLVGRRVLLFAEQGHGDGIQFARFATMVAASGAAMVGIEAPPALTRLLATVPGVDRVHPLGGTPPGNYDLFAPLMSLPHLFGITSGSVPATVPYLFPPPSSESLRERLRVGFAGRDVPRIGLVWSGDARPHDRRQNEANRRRRVPLPMLLDALEGFDCLPVSLQLGEGRDELVADPRRARVFDPMDAVADFADTAAVVAELDVVVSVCTAAAHLVGAMGRPVFIPLAFRACWRWMEGRDDSPWYPDARLFRQRAEGDWTPVIGGIVDALKGFSIPNHRRRW